MFTVVTRSGGDLFTYFSWWYGDGLIRFWQAIQIMTEKVYSFFSITLLLRTIFDPWKRDAYYIENAAIDIRIKIWFNNLISRVIGFIIRLFTIFAGLVVTSVFFIFLIVILLGWVFLPIVVIFLIINGLKVMLNAQI